jgi:hypothetical protein
LIDFLIEEFRFDYFFREVDFLRDCFLEILFDFDSLSSPSGIMILKVYLRSFFFVDGGIFSSESKDLWLEILEKESIISIGLR